MGSSYYITFGGNRLTFPGATGSVAWEDTNQLRTLTLSAGANGSISADTLTGYDGDVVTLSTTPSAHHHFSAYSITGATLTGNQFAFSGSDVTAEASFDVDRYRIIFGENNGYSAGLTATFNGTTVYSRAVGSAQATATGIPYGSVLTMSASSPKYTCFTVGTLSAVSASGGLTYDGQRDGIGMSVTGILTGDGSYRLANGHSKVFRVQGNFPTPGAGGHFATIYCRPTAYSSWVGTGYSANSKLHIRNSWTANMTSHCGNSWGAGGDVVHVGWQPRNVSSLNWSGYCDTTGKCYTVNGYLEWKAGFNTFGSKGSAAYISRTWGNTTNQVYFAAGRSATGSNAVVTAVAGYFWCTGIAP